MSEGSKKAVRADDEVVAPPKCVGSRIGCELERLLRRKTMEVEILKEALELARAKKPRLLSHSPLLRDIR
jgi:transposase